MPNSEVMPFHVAHPMPYIYDIEQQNEQESSLMKAYYPEVAMMIQEHVDRECDKMEYDGSMMYDEYPDKTTLEQIALKIAQKVQAEMSNRPAETKKPMEYTDPSMGRTNSREEMNNWGMNREAGMHHETDMNREARMNNRGMGMNNRGMGMNNRGMGMNNRGMGMNNQTMGMDPGMSMNQGGRMTDPAMEMDPFMRGMEADNVEMQQWGYDRRFDRRFERGRIERDRLDRFERREFDRHGRCRDPFECNDLSRVLLLNEIFRRRCRHGRCGRFL